MASIPAIINPPMLRWAREEAGYTIDDVAQKTAISAIRIEAWESGEERPTLRQAEKLAKIYHRAYSVFVLSKPPLVPPLASEFRRLPGVKPGEESPELRLALREILNRRSAALHLVSELAKQPMEFALGARVNDSVEKIAKSLRTSLGVSVQTQQEWKNEYEAFRSWRNAIEGLGVLVFQFSKVDLGEARGVSVLRFPLPIIGVNNREIPASKPFTLFHELVHIMLTVAQPERVGTELSVERFAERVSSATLMPEGAVRAEPEVASRSSQDEVEVSFARKLARRYKVTPSAFVTRLLSLNLVSNSAYRKWKEDWEAYQELHPPPEGGGIATPEQKALNRTGKTFASLVLEAMSTERINAVDACQFLDLNISYVDRLRESLIFGVE